MEYRDYLEIIADWAAILTAAIATVAYLRFVGAQLLQRRAVEDYLREEKLRSQDEGKRTVIHLMAYLALTEAEVLHACFQSKKIKANPGIDDQGRAVRIYYEYDGADIPQRRKF